MTGPKKKPQTTTVPAKPKQQTSQTKQQQASQPKQQKQQAAKPKQQQATPKHKPAAPASKPQPVKSSPRGYENGHEWVDLGLSVKWATMNVGASSPTDYGSYFAWGETRTKSDYSWSTYFDTNDGGSTFFKYDSDNKTRLDLSDDAAHANWGGSWRMPTRAEQSELHWECTWTWTTQNGVEGYKVSSKRNSKSIFLPAAGYRNEGSLYDAGSYGLYWPSSFDSSDLFYLYFLSGNVVWRSGGRYYGLSVRAVCQ